MKRIFIFMLLGLFLFVAGKSLFMYYKADCNNLIFILSNTISWTNGNKKKVPYSINISLDGKLLYKNDSIIDFYHSESIRRKVPIGKHKLTVNINSNITNEMDILIFPMKWIIIEYNGVGYENNGSFTPVLVTTYESEPKLE